MNFVDTHAEYRYFKNAIDEQVKTVVESGRFLLGDKPRLLEESFKSIVGKDTEVIEYNTEADLLLGYAEFLQTYRPNIVTGYNILGFDIQYMIERAKFNLVIDQFKQLGFTEFISAQERQIKWSSAAYKTQNFKCWGIWIWISTSRKKSIFNYETAKRTYSYFKRFD